MEKIDIIFWILGGGFGLMVVMWNNINKRIDDLAVKLDRRIDDLSAKGDRNEAKFNAKLDTKIDPIEKDLIQMNTKMAVMESRLSDIRQCLQKASILASRLFCPQ